MAGLQQCAVASGVLAGDTGLRTGCRGAGTVSAERGTRGTVCPHRPGAHPVGQSRWRNWAAAVPYRKPSGSTARNAPASTSGKVVCRGCPALLRSVLCRYDGPRAPVQKSSPGFPASLRPLVPSRSQEQAWTCDEAGKSTPHSPRSSAAHAQGLQGVHLLASLQSHLPCSTGGILQTPADPALVHTLPMRSVNPESPLGRSLMIRESDVE